MVMKSKQKLSDPPHQRVKLKKKKIQKICNKVQMVVVCLNSYAKFLCLNLNKKCQNWQEKKMLSSMEMHMSIIKKKHGYFLLDDLN